MLLTDWHTICTSGSTADGRSIKEKWLTDIADTYSTEEYTAIINSEHDSSYGNFGAVHDVRVSKDSKNRVILQARLSPNYRLLEKNRNGQGIFTSVEINPNFARTRKAYLVGLAITDNPASLGTTPIKFKNQAFDHIVLGNFEKIQLKVNDDNNKDFDMSIEENENFDQQNDDQQEKMHHDNLLNSNTCNQLINYFKEVKNEMVNEVKNEVKNEIHTLNKELHENDSIKNILNDLNVIKKEINLLKQTQPQTQLSSDYTSCDFEEFI